MVTLSTLRNPAMIAVYLDAYGHNWRLYAQYPCLWLPAVYTRAESKEEEQLVSNV